MEPTFVRPASLSFLLLTTLAFFSASVNAHVGAHAAGHKGLHNGLHRRALTISSTLPSGWSSLGCYTDSTSSRTLTGSFYYNTTAMTEESCVTFCNGNNYPYAGVEYAQECYCGNTITSPGAAAAAGDCNMACVGAASEECGGSDRINIFHKGPVSTTTTTTTSSTKTTSSISTTKTTSSISTTKTTSSISTTKTTSSTTTSSSPTSTSGIPKPWTYRGCYVDNTYGRILAYQQSDSSTQTRETCVNACIGLGYTVAGIEYSTQCFCGNAIIENGTLASSDSQCAMTCGGNSGEICGGPNLMSIFANGTLNTYAPPTVQKTGLPGTYKYQGCLTDQAQPRVFPYEIDGATNMTINACLSLCLQYGYPAGGVEYGSQCFCGDDSDRVNASAAYRAETDCNMACSGNATVLCGGPNAIQYYTYTGNIQTWTVATGNAAGAYQFLIGGVVIPLITTASLNGKVSFVEKHGTGPPNSTGAYELDLSLVNNFTAAWRTMNGLKTDVFCSASLVLPDKAGRQLNIGGWSTSALYGVRLYWPDGSPGNPSVHDWQEDVSEVTLQTGRWYPSAMIMANGSILVVGGENGSNGPPVPNLEVVPQPAGGGLVYCDWLNRTDPNNLYPFLAVLPSGGIFVAYYNEARILNENTFATTTVMPNIPGAVNNFLGGRTYPLEGTSMIMPQKAPYTDPLTILICGGSTPNSGVALDNCVSIQPEVANANWTIERMPSQRVISCMTALPDGTYLILNGAEQGYAGFGLASNPNHNAVLYDPTKPKNARMTILANTTIDRLYHSEAILLQDGRVLVSGSDPEGAPYVQEYRVEVFIPPYLMGSPARPAYTITAAQSDWTYGSTHTITITSGTASKISLMGAVSSTHGNSMGQRTLFPTFSCSGTTCTITAPPNAHVCPPGWFMLFVLNAAGVPSTSQWVRIGGDPAKLGNWPNFPDFIVPGV